MLAFASGFAVVRRSIRLECCELCCRARHAARADLELIGTGSCPTEPMQLTKVKPSWYSLLQPLTGYRGSFAESLEPEWGRPFTGLDTQSFSPHGSLMLEWLAGLV